MLIGLMCYFCDALGCIGKISDEFIVATNPSSPEKPRCYVQEDRKVDLKRIQMISDYHSMTAMLKFWNFQAYKDDNQPILGNLDSFDHFGISKWGGIGTKRA